MKTVKKKLFLLSVLISVFKCAYGDSYLAVDAVSVPQGGMGSINIVLNNDVPFTAFTMRLTLPDGISYLSIEKGNRFADSHSVSAVPSGNVISFGCLSTANEPIAGNSGVLLSVNIMADASLAVGSSLTATLTDADFSTTTGEESLMDVDITLSITDKYTLLDESSTIAPISETNTNVRVKRTINAGEWSTLVLPFDMTAAQVYEVFGDDVELQEFIDYEANDDLTQITINFEPALIAEDGLMANYPYVIRTSRDITEFTVDGVTIDPDEEGAVAEYTNGRTGSRKVVYAYFQGTYKAGTVIPADNLFLSDNQFWYSVGMTQTKAYRAYFWLQDMLASASDGASSRIILNVGNGGVATGITSHESQAVGGSEVYDLQGRRVDIPSRKGLYIRDGKKVVINN